MFRQTIIFFWYVPNFNQADFDKIRYELAQVDWNNEFAGLDACESWESFKIILNEVQRRNVQFKYKRNCIHDRPSWLTPEVRNAIKKEKKCF